MNRSLCICVAFVFFILGMTVTSLLVQWPFVEASFWHLTLRDLLSFAIPLVIAALVTHLVSEHVNKDAKRRELVLGYVDKLQEALRILQQHGQEYMHSPKPALEDVILAEYKGVDNLLAFLRNVHRDDIVKCTSLFRAHGLYDIYIASKKILTGSQFRTVSPMYDQGSKLRFDDSYGRMCVLIDECKIRLFD